MFRQGSYFRHRFTSDTIEQVFQWILWEANRAGCLSLEAVYLDGTHIKANANIQKKIKKQVPIAAARYKDELFEEINRDREAHGKPPFDDDEDEPPKEKEITVSTTDPESGIFHKGEHKRCFAYEAHTACDGHGFVLDTVVTPGNVHDSVAFHPLYDRLTERFPQIHAIVADTAYKTPSICKRIFDDGRVLSSAYKRPQIMKGGHEWYKYVYDEYYDIIICPEYKSRSYICRNCPTIEKCTHSKSCEKIVARHVWHDYIELAEDARYTPYDKTLYEKRKEKIERVFADAKEKHAMRYTPFRGLAQVTNWLRLRFAATNLKKLASWLRRRRLSLPVFCFLAFFPFKNPFSSRRKTGFSTR